MLGSDPKIKLIIKFYLPGREFLWSDARMIQSNPEQVQ